MGSSPVDCGRFSIITDLYLENHPVISNILLAGRESLLIENHYSRLKEKQLVGEYGSF